MPLKNKVHQIAPIFQRTPGTGLQTSNAHQSHANAAVALRRAAIQHLSTLRPADLLTLQRAIGNRAVQRVLAGPTRNGPASSAGPVVHAKLTIGPASDIYEQEADRVARQVMSMDAPPVERSIQRAKENDEKDFPGKPSAISTAPLVQPRITPHDEELQKISLPRESSAGLVPAPLEIETAIKHARGAGQSLPETVRVRMEGAFGADFSGVRVHTDAAADRLNRSLQARAFTTGQDLFFKRGEYNPDSRAGQEVLAHELTHVVQQSGGRVAPAPASAQSLQRAKLFQPQGPPPSANLIQTLSWPGKNNEKEARKELIEQLQTNNTWGKVSELNTKKVYEWCSTEVDWDRIPSNMTWEEVQVEMNKYPKGSDLFFHDERLKTTEEFVDYVKILRKDTKAAVGYSQYNEKDYKKPSGLLEKDVQESKLTLDQIKILSGDLYNKLWEADKARFGAKWEKDNNKEWGKANPKELVGQKTKDQNERISKAKVDIDKLIEEARKEKATKDIEAKAKSEKADAILAASQKAEQLKEFTDVANNDLAKKIWQRSVTCADKSGYIELDAIFHPLGDVEKATAALNTFSAAWTKANSDKELLKNPHCPGGGKVQFKGGHKDEHIRTSMYQANFIASWGKYGDPNIHINSEEPS